MKARKLLPTVAILQEGKEWLLVVGAIRRQKNKPSLRQLLSFLKVANRDVLKRKLP